MKFEESLSEALRDAVAAYNETGDPDRSVVKAAEKHGFNRDQTERLVEKFNTAKTISFYEAHPDDRTGSFSLASKEKVAEVMYFAPEEKKAAARPPADYSFYDSDLESWRSEEGRSELQKEAEAEERSDSGGYSLQMLHLISGDYLGKYASVRDAASDAAGMLEQVVYDETERLAGKLAEDRSGYRYAVFSMMAPKMRGVPELRVDDMVPGYVKEAAAEHSGRLSSMNAVDSQSVMDELEMAAGIVGLADRAAELRKKASAVEAKREWIKSRLHKAAAGDDDGGKKGGKKSSMGKDIAEYVANTIVPASPSGITEFLEDAGMGSSEDLYKALYGSGEKKHDVSDYIDNVRRSDILTDLYANDPILSDRDPGEVSDAYKTLVETAPDMSLNKEVARSVLRQMVAAQAVSPFDAKQWIDYDLTRRKSRRLSPFDNEYRVIS